MSYESTGILRVGGAPVQSSMGAPVVVQKEAYQDRATHWHGTPTDTLGLNPLGGKESFAYKLHQLLECAEENGFDDVIGWQPHGRAFKVHSPQDFLHQVAPKYFKNQTRFSSFQRQLNMYGFIRIRCRGDDFGCYYHEMFLRGRPMLCSYMQRRSKKAPCMGYLPLSLEPDLYSMPYVYKNASSESETSVTPPVSFFKRAVQSARKQTSLVPNASIAAKSKGGPRHRSSGPCNDKNRGIGSAEESSSLSGMLDTTDPLATPRDGKLQRLPKTMTHFPEISNHPAASLKHGNATMNSQSEQLGSSCSGTGKWPHWYDDSLHVKQVQSVPAAADILEAIDYCIDFGK